MMILILGSLLLSAMHCPLSTIFYDDKEIFQYTGRAILHGAVPYLDFFDHKPPLIFFLNAIGQIFGSWGLWVIDTALVLFTSIVWFRCCQKRLANAWILPLLFNLLIRLPLLSNGIGMTR